MTERLEEVRKRRAVIGEIGEVVGALRAIAAARANEAESAVEAIELYEESVTAAFARLALPVAAPAEEGAGLLLVIGAAQGFCGAYPARLIEALHKEGPAEAGLVVIGQRTGDMLADEGIDPLWSGDLPAAPQFVPDLASAVTDALVELGPEHPGPVRVLSGRDQPGLPIAIRQIWPPAPDSGDGSAPALPRTPPLTTMPMPELLRGLLTETLFAEVARAIMQGLQAENRARVEAMTRAQSNLKERRTEVEQKYRQARQEEMTTEVIELSAGMSRR